MALRVWLPLNGNLDNNGLSPVTVTNNGATVNDAGKIGKCYAFNGNHITITNPLSTSTPEFSICAWVYVTGLNNGYGPVFNSRTGVSGKGIVFWLTNSGVRLDDGAMWEPSCTYSKNAWVHVCYTRSSGKKCIYINGALITSTTTVGDMAGVGTTAYIAKDQRSPSTYFMNGRMNDVRIYDHCLSPREVKEISRGLVLHYKLDGSNDTILPFGYQQLEYIESSGDMNYIDTGIVPTINTGIKFKMTRGQIRSQDVLFGASNGGEFSGNKTFAIDIINGTGTLFAYGAETTGTEYNKVIIDFSPSIDTPYEYRLNYKNDKIAGVENLTATLISPSYMTYRTIRLMTYHYDDAGTVSRPVSPYMPKLYYSIITEGDNVIQYLIPAKKLSDNTIGMFDVITNTFFTNGGVGTFSAGPVISTPAIVPDCSGYKRNGTPSGAITTSDNPPRYKLATKYTDSSCSIGIGNLSTYIPDGNFTFSIWFKKVTGGWSSKAWETLLGGPSGFELETKQSGTNSPVIDLYSWGRGTATYSLDVWNHLVLTRNSGGSKLYLNGELKVSGSAGSIPSSNYYIGSLNSLTGQNYRGHLSDARIYSTCLDAEDIKELYNTSALIHNDGTIEAFEFVETESGSPEVTKTGLVKAQKHVEQPTLCEYLESDGDAYINTLIPYDSTKDTYRIECKFSQPSNVGQYDGVFGAYKGESYKTLRCIRLGDVNSMGFYYNVKAGGGNPIIPSGANTNIREIVFTYSTLIVTQNGTTTTYTYGKRVAATDNNDRTFFLFRCSETASKSKSRIYYFRLYDGDTLLCNMVPCILNGVPGMWDIVGSKFYGNDGTGTFTTGAQQTTVASLFANKTIANQIIES